MKKLLYHSQSLSHLIKGAAVILMVLASGLFLSCNSERAKKEAASVTKDSSAVAFKPNPQKIEKHEVQTMKIGDKAVEFKLPDVTGRYYQLSDFKSSRSW